MDNAVKNPGGRGSTDESAAERRSRFRELVTVYAALVKAEDVDILPYRSEDVPHFSALSRDEQTLVLDRLDRELEVFAEMKSEGLSFRDSPRFLWRIVGRLELTPQKDIFDRIEADDVVSLYSCDQRQIFQNLRFLELVSLTLEEIYSLPWYSYSKRAAAIEASLYKYASQVLDGTVTQTLSPDVEEHIGQEVGTEGRVILSVKVKWISPARFKDGSMGMIVINRCKQIGGRSNSGYAG